MLQAYEDFVEMYPDERLVNRIKQVSVRKHRTRYCWFPGWKVGIFSPGKEIKGLRGGVHWYAAQAKPKIDAARGKKHPFPDGN